MRQLASNIISGGAGMNCELASYGPLLSGLALSAAATAAWTTLLVYNRRTIEAAWIDSLRKLHAEFWNDDEMAKVRKWLSSESEYKKLEDILLRRLSADENNMSSEENDRLEDIDRFCALMSRIGYFGRRSHTWEQAQHYKFTLAHWLVKMKSRKALIDYAARFWTPLYEIVEQESYNNSKIWFRSRT